MNKGMLLRNAPLYFGALEKFVALQQYVIALQYEPLVGFSATKNRRARGAAGSVVRITSLWSARLPIIATMPVMPAPIVAAPIMAMPIVATIINAMVIDAPVVPGFFGQFRRGCLRGQAGGGNGCAGAGPGANVAKAEKPRMIAKARVRMRRMENSIPKRSGGIQSPP